MDAFLQMDLSSGRKFALYEIIHQNNISALQRLLAEDVGVKLSEDELNCALHMACMCGRKECVEQLLDSGAEINCRQADGGTPLASCIAYYGGQDLVDFLIKAGADVNAVAPEKSNYGSWLNAFTPLISAVYREQSNNVEVLLLSGADPDLHDSDFYTPLFYAVELGSMEMVKTLLQYNCKPDIRTKLEIYSHTSRDMMPFLVPPVHWALTWERFDIAKNLILAGARVDRNKLFTLPLIAQSACIQSKIMMFLQKTPKVLPLRDLCRLAVRKSLDRGCVFKGKVEALPLPGLMKDYLLMKEL